ncbi:MAG: [Fe-Fe] hydrogenase large subunit C-terminal domain-containing protein [Christensenellales bacterium]|jgi:iron only hydrogenase large subunit-like protein|nr:[Fe-Fe] hydrogenase large subunit C-terminal domain-containing protein [Eubacteriales bacterium]
MLEKKILHTVVLNTERCKGCVTCMKRCPTEAIRVRHGKASVNYEKCIGCGECVRICPYHAKQAAYDAFETINDYKYKIAIPAPSLFGQFENPDIDTILNGLIAIGFDAVYEVGRGAELLSEATKIVLDQGKLAKPVISTACPAVLELILVRFSHFKPNLLNMLAPVDIAAKLAREKAIAAGVPADDIGVFFISPCPAKVFALKMGLGHNKPVVDGVLAISDIYKRLRPVLGKLENIKPLSKMGGTGLGWAASGGEAAAVFRSKYLAADGIENVINVLNAIEDNALKGLEFIELNACVSGCVGGVLNVENPFVAKARLREIKRKLPEKCNTLANEGRPLEFYLWEQEPDFKDVFRLDESRVSAMDKLLEMEKTLGTLPLVDCGMCGAPSCRAFAEDKANGIVPADYDCPRLNEKTEKSEESAEAE